MYILLVRHTEADIEPGRCYGRLDIDLSPEGRAAIPALAAHLRASGIATVWTSPSRRCRSVAEAVHPAARVDPRLQELDFGDWEGRRWDDIDRDALDAWARDPLSFAAPGGETGAALIARVAAFAASLRAQGRDAIVVTHGGPLRLLPALLDHSAPDLLAAAPALGSITVHHCAHTAADSAAHSAATAQPPSTSPVKPPI